MPIVNSRETTGKLSPLGACTMLGWMTSSLLTSSIIVCVWFIQIISLFMLPIELTHT